MPETASQSSGARAARKRFDARIGRDTVDAIDNLLAFHPALHLGIAEA
jgi:hypothetical protein